MFTHTQMLVARSLRRTQSLLNSLCYHRDRMDRVEQNLKEAPANSPGPPKSDPVPGPLRGTGRLTPVTHTIYVISFIITYLNKTGQHIVNVTKRSSCFYVETQLLLKILLERYGSKKGSDELACDKRIIKSFFFGQNQATKRLTILKVIESTAQIQAFQLFLLTNRSNLSL